MVKSFILLTLLLLFSSSVKSQVFYENELFSIYFPTAPILTKEKVDYGDKIIKLYGLTSTNDEGRLYTVNYYEYPENTVNIRSVSLSKSILESFIELKNIKTEEEPETFSLKEYNGMQCAGYSKIEKKYYNLRVFLHEGYVVQIGIVSDKNLPHKRIVKNFYKGFEFKKNQTK